MVVIVVMKVGLSLMVIPLLYTTRLLKNGASLWCLPLSHGLWEVYVEPYVEGDVYTVVESSISVDHDMDGGAVTPDIILNQDNNVLFFDSSLLGGTSSSINATFKLICRYTTGKRSI